MDNFTLKNKKFCISSKTNSGKSQLLRYLLIKNKRHFRKIFLICPTERINNFYSKVIPKENVFDEFNAKWVEALIKKMTEINSGVEEDKRTQIFIIFDDCCSDADFHHSKVMRILFTRGRHLGIGVAITSQYIYHIPPILRNNCDYIIVGQMNKQGVEILAQEYNVGNLSSKEFMDLYYKCTRDYQFMVINNNSVKDISDLNSLYGTLKTPPEYLKC